MPLWFQAKHGACRSQNLPMAKRAITGLYKLNIENPMGCAQRVAYLIEEDRFICPPDKYEVLLFNIAADYSDPRKA